jgi:O-antigen/teichoic acid export membrane protein
VTSLRGSLQRFRSTELGGLARDSFHVGIWQGAVSVADLVQLALITHILGLNAFGRLALVMSFVVLIGQFFDVRVGTATTRFGAERLAAGDVQGFAGLLQFSYLIDVTAGVLSFIVIACLAPFVGPHLVGGNGASLLLLYALTLLISTADESSASVLRLLDRFRLLAAASGGVEALRVLFVAMALAIDSSLTSVLIALIAYDLAGAIVNFAVASSVFSRTFGRSLLALCLDAFREKRQMIRMVLQTNIVSYARIAQVQLPTLLLGVLSTTTQVAYYRLGSSAAAMVGRIADPGYAAVLPRLARLWATGHKNEVRQLVKRSSAIAAGVMAGALVVVLLARGPILSGLGGRGGREAATAMILLATGQAVNGALFWNTGLLFAAGRAGIVTIVALIGIGVQVGLLVPLVAIWAAGGAAAATLVAYIVTNTVATIAALRIMQASVDGGAGQIDAAAPVSSG